MVSRARFSGLYVHKQHSTSLTSQLERSVVISWGSAIRYITRPSVTLVLISNEISFFKGFPIVWADGTNSTQLLFIMRRAKGSEVAILLTWLSLSDTLVIRVSTWLRIGESESIAVLASVTVAFTFGSFGFGTSFAEIFCTVKEQRKLSHGMLWNSSFFLI